MSKEVIQAKNALSISTEEMVHQAKAIQEVMRALFVEGEHYGKIPGTAKVTLLKSGAEKIQLMFRLSSTYEVHKVDMPNGHREYMVMASVSDQSGRLLSQGVGVCSTMESKYRWRKADNYEITDQTIPRDAKDRKAHYRKQGYGMQKIDGAWYWVRYLEGARQENPDIADVYNTVIKMAKKRALVDATLTATAASDIFTQDVDDMESREDAWRAHAAHEEPQPEQPGHQPQPQPQPQNGEGQHPKRRIISEDAEKYLRAIPDDVAAKIRARGWKPSEVLKWAKYGEHGEMDHDDMRSYFGDEPQPGPADA